MTTRVCPACREEKPLSDYHKRRATKNGFACYCKVCDIAKSRAAAASPERKAAKKVYDAARYQINALTIKPQERARYLENREHKIAYAAAWIARNPEKRRFISMAYKARRRSVEKAGVSGATLAAWVAEQAKVCFWCSNACGDNYHVDHYVPLSKGGLHEIDNLVIACPPCNLSKQARMPEVFAKIREAAQ